MPPRSTALAATLGTESVVFPDAATAASWRTPTGSPTGYELSQPVTERPWVHRGAVHLPGTAAWVTPAVATNAENIAP